ncbi:MAG: CDGSH iron-sulfur domain-containing protein [Symploca sp. SIO3C6]|uniref:CDGSH iron-sulfur domain-containing protein n=1 Tax=Symploca sp. SIO1C4 TaxID=2607765 RepID=A0A6B3NBV5_9CYAN|nr:CDGSH iron-sulfur domain-containing protein [Symploca sp. SIO3C6]NER29023.1 CDGSH iron-sulfur domain-containing protein [Symploca sp. SIO1C4]NET05188.1 CDGSH iron-sulfur domain-containing protein [Symploca sp. SIO2B6]
MSQPIIVAKQPTVLELEPGTYYKCACGKSNGQPFCDGSHKGTEFLPTRFKLEEKKKVALCACNYSNNSAFCDGTHAKL